MIKLGLSPRPKNPAQLRSWLIRLGPTFIKIGQFLALRPDLIGPEYADELLALLDDVPAEPWPNVCAILEADLGPLDELFDHVQPDPLAAGSLAQVHLARTRDGQDIALKILRPGIDTRIESDLRRMRILSRVIQHARLRIAVRPAEVVDELAHLLRRELDLRNELAHLERMVHLVADSTIQHIPECFAALSSRRVLAMAPVRGVPLTRLLKQIRDGGQQAVREHYPEIDVQRVAENLMEATFVQMFRFRFFHADVHPGNLLVLPNDVIGYVDFGLCDAIEPTIFDNHLRYLTAVFDGDEAQMFNALQELLVPAYGANKEQLRIDFHNEMRSLSERIDARGEFKSDASDSPISQWLIGMMNAARQNRYTVPPRLLSAYRTLLTAESITFQLTGESQISRIGRRFFTRLHFEEMVRSMSPSVLKSSIPSFVRLLKHGPRMLEDILTDLSEGRFELNVMWSEDGPTRQAKSRRSRLLTLSIVSVGMSVLLGATLLTDRPPPFALWTLIVITVVLHIVLAVQWLRLR